MSLEIQKLIDKRDELNEQIDQAIIDEDLKLCKKNLKSKGFYISVFKHIDKPKRQLEGRTILDDIKDFFKKSEWYEDVVKLKLFIQFSSTEEIELKYNTNEFKISISKSNEWLVELKYDINNFINRLSIEKIIIEKRYIKMDNIFSIPIYLYYTPLKEKPTTSKIRILRDELIEEISTDEQNTLGSYSWSSFFIFPPRMAVLKPDYCENISANEFGDKVQCPNEKLVYHGKKLSYCNQHLIKNEIPAEILDIYNKSNLDSENQYKYCYYCRKKVKSEGSSFCNTCEELDIIKEVISLNIENLFI